MGIQDRDYYYEKRDDHNSNRDEKKPPINNSSKGSFKTLTRYTLIWLSLVSIFLIILSYYKPQLLNKPQIIDNFSIGNSISTDFLILRRCESLPSHGSSHVIDPSVMKRSDVLYSGLEIQNKHNYPIVVILSDLSGSKRYLAVSVSSGNTTEVSVPTGQYGMQILTGSEWCNLKEGFSGGVNLSITGGILIKAGETAFIQLNASGQRPEQVSVNFDALRPPINSRIIEQSAEVSSLNKLDLLQTREGHYFSSGTINHLPVVFMIDTGATNVSVSSEVASRAGIKKCSPRLVSTANGNINACTAIVPKITFGKFKLNNIEVTVMPNMSTDALLGMNVLKNFRIEQVGKVMRIFTQ